jgi:dTDP-4-amino-4,6-dideoxygalactose transaminase
MSDILAIDGGDKVRVSSNPPWPIYDDDEIQAVMEVLRSGKVNYWTGHQCKDFEIEYANHVGVEFGVAVANGTVALELALRSLGIGLNDEVIVPARTFFASASCVVACGAIPVFADIDPITQNLNVETINAALTEKTRAIIAVHLGGWPCDMTSILDFAKQHQLYVVEDCAQAHGARYKESVVGSFGDVAAYSFCQDKIISTGGEGGMLLTNNKEIFERAWAYKDHGKSYVLCNTPPKAPGFRWLHETCGSNYRMTEMQAAIGRIQLKKLSQWVVERRQNASYLAAELEKIPGLIVPIPSKEFTNSYYRLYAFIDTNCIKPEWNQLRLLETICAEGVPCYIGSCPEVYREMAFTKSQLTDCSSLSNAKKLGDNSLAFLVHPGNKESDLLDVAKAVRKVFSQAVI